MNQTFVIKSKNKIVFKSNVKHTDMLIKAGREAAANAIGVSKALGLPITYIEDGATIQEFPDGVKNIIRPAIANKKIEPAISLKKGMICMQKNTSEPFEFLGIIHKSIRRFLLIFFD